MAQRYHVDNPVVSPKPKIATKPVIATKPAYLKKQPSVNQQDLESDKLCRQEPTKAPPVLVKQPSLNHVTPKLWIKTPSFTEPEKKKPQTDTRKNVPPSPFGATKWRPAPQIHTKSSGQGSRTPPRLGTVVSTPDSISERPKQLSVDINTEKSYSSGDITPVEKEPSHQRLRPTLSGPRTPIPYRPSFRRGDKSPGFGSLVKMWDFKAKDVPIAAERSSIKQKTVPEGDTWKSVSPAIQSKDNNSSNDLSTRNSYRNRSASINFQSPKPYVSRSSTKNFKVPETMDPVITQQQNDQQAFAFDESAVNQYSGVEVDAQLNSSVKVPETKLTSEEILAHADTGIYNEPSDSDSLEDVPGMNVATYQEFDENDEDVQNAMYSVAEDVPSSPTNRENTMQGYLPMTGNAPDSMVEIRYEAMSTDTHIPDIDNMNMVVPPPVITGKPKREYHEIDPNVPPPPERDPPKLPPGIKSSKSLDESLPPEPPPLPPDNVIGRRSMMLSKEKKLLVVKDLNERVNAGTKKLNYAEVETSVYVENTFTPQPKTNYSDVVLLSEIDRGTRDRSGSGTSEEGLSNVSKNKSKVKKKFGKLFSSREDLRNSPEKETEKELTTDFEKERNKKKRISGRFLRNKKKTENKKEKRASDIKNAESDSGTYDHENFSPPTSVHTSRSTSVVTTSGGGSTQSSGDGEVVATALPSEDRPVKWKVLPTPVNDHRRWSNEVPPAPSMAPRGYKKTPSNPAMISSEGLYSTGDDIIYPPVQETPKVISFLHGTNQAQNGGSKSPPKPYPRQSSLQQITPVVYPPHSQGISQPTLPYVTPANPTSPIPRRPPKSDAVREKYGEDADGGDAPPPIPDRDDDEGYEFIPEASNLVPPSPFPLKATSKFLDSEPLYQVYRNRTMSHASTRRRSQKSVRDRSTSSEQTGEWKSDFMSEDLGTTTLWRSLPEVVAKGVAKGMTPEELKLQQAQFEVITSQASYLRSLNILVSHFMDDWAMESSDVLPTQDRHVLFSNIKTVRSVEQKFLQDLEKHFWKEYRLSKVCDLVAQFAKHDFDVYVRYIQNQTFQDRTLTRLQRSHDRFQEELSRLETSPACNKLPLLSFLLLPMQRVTRLPLLVSAIVNAADAAGDLKFVKRARHALGVVNQLVKKCNEGARKMQQTEQLAEIASQLDYAPSVKTFALISLTRNLVKKGEMMVTLTTESAKKKDNRGKMWLFLFSDVLFIARKKSFMESGGSTRYEVINWSKRNLLYVNERAVSENTIFLIILEDQSGRRVEATLSPNSQNELSRWTDALNPPNQGSTGESIYESWDCPQYTCVEPYTAQQPDELSIDVNDVMQVLKKTSDGWLEGERLRDGEVGWFPAINCEEIEDEHVRVRNMKNLYKTIYT